MKEEKEIAELLKPLLEKKGYDLYSIRLAKGKETRLELVVDRPSPIGLDDIVALSEEVSAYLDEKDPIEEAYTLDLSSAGAEKEIDPSRLKEYLGKYVHLHLSHPYKGENILEGRLLECQSDGEIALEVKDKAKKKEARFPAKDVDKARLAIEF